MKTSAARLARPALLGLIAPLTLLIIFTPPPAEGRVGDWGDPIEVTALPFTHAGDTRGRSSQVSAYDCASGVSEEGPEVVYRVQVPVAGELRAWVEGDGGGVDIDVQVLSRAQLSGGVAQGCLARHNALASAPVAAGEAWVVVDSYAGAAQAGPYRLRVDLQPADGWYRRPVAQGVWLETKEYASLFGGRQTGSVLRVDLSAPGVSVRPIGGSGCATTSSLARAAGAVAAVNAGFFSVNERCDSLSLLKEDGVVRSRNARGRASFGVTAQGAPMTGWVAAGADWPSARQAVGGLSQLVSAGGVDVQWERDGASSDFTFGRNPRTAVGFAGEEVILGVLDGRTGAGLGVGLPDLAQWMVWLGAREAINLDGGGSSTLWARGEPAGGVVSFPSDNGLADHAGERAVSSALGVFAPPLAREAAWVARPGPTALMPGEVFEAELLPIDPDGEPLSLWARTTGLGELSVEPFFDGAGVLRYVPAPSDAARVELTVEARAGDRVDGVWRVTLSVIGGGGQAVELGGAEGAAGESAGESAGVGVGGEQGAGEEGGGEQAGAGAGEEGGAGGAPGDPGGVSGGGVAAGAAGRGGVGAPLPPAPSSVAGEEAGGPQLLQPPSPSAQPSGAGCAATRAGGAPQTPSLLSLLSLLSALACARAARRASATPPSRPSHSDAPHASSPPHPLAP